MNRRSVILSVHDSKTGYFKEVYVIHISRKKFQNPLYTTMVPAYAVRVQSLQEAGLFHTYKDSFASMVVTGMYLNAISQTSLDLLLMMSSNQRSGNYAKTIGRTQKYAVLLIALAQKKAHTLAWDLVHRQRSYVSSPCLMILITG